MVSGHQIQRFYLFSLLLFGAVYSVHGQSCERESMVLNFFEQYLSSRITVTDLDWTGSSTDSICEAGGISAVAYERALKRINYFRALTGAPSVIIFDTTLNGACQDAALMVRANNTVSGNSTPEWECYNPQGDLALGYSLVSLGSPVSEGLTGFIRGGDLGDPAVQSRMAMLFSRANAFGLGATNNSMVLWVEGPEHDPPTEPDFIAYPSAGYFPAPLVFATWTFAKAGADFSNAEVNMSNSQGYPIPITFLGIGTGNGDPTIIWQPHPDHIELNNGMDQKYSVEVGPVLFQGQLKHYEYEVIIAQVVHPPACPELSIWDEDSCACIDSIATHITGVPVLNTIGIEPNPANNQIQVFIDAAQSYSGRVEIISMDGQGQLSSSIAGTSGYLRLPLNLSDLTPGLYYIRVDLNSGTRHIFPFTKL